MLLSLSSMPSQLVRTVKYAIVVALILTIKPSLAQNKYQRISDRIDSLANIGLPKSALAEVDKLEKLARQDNNAPQQIRAVIYRMTFQSYLEENALVAIISRLKADIVQSKFPVKPVLQSLLAETYWKYYQQNRYQFIQRSQLAERDTSFTQWDLKTIISETSNLYALSLTEAKRLQNTPVSELDGVLEGDESTRYLRPSLYDLLVQRAFEFYLTEEPGLTRPKLPFMLNNTALFSDSRAFSQLHFTTTDTASNYYRGVKYLQQATLYHLQNNHQEALADIDLKRLRFMYEKADVTDKDSLYLSALKYIASNFSSKPISSEALVFQGQYYQGLDSLTIAYGLFKKAAAAYPQSLGGKNAATLIARIEAKEISAIVEEINVPDKPILALLNYKNVNAAKVVLYRLTEDQMSEYLKAGDVPSYNTEELSKFRLAFLEKFKPFKQHQYKWTDNRDYRKHSAEVKIDALPRGSYVLLVKEAVTNDKSLSGLSDFKVSGLSYIARSNPNGKNEIRVMDRVTGLPISGVQVSLSKSNTPNWKYIDDAGTTDNNGLFLSQKYLNYTVSIRLTHKGDTLIKASQYISGQIVNSDSDDDAEDKTVLFTDRQIYRPGQTIYFKGLQLQTLGEKSKIIADKPVEVTFNDVNGKQVAVLQLKSNEFGTFSGSFVIPQNMLTGDVELETDDGSIQVKVEEYKRPTFQVVFLSVKENYKFNDSVVVKANVTAFSGYGLSQARVAYRITRSENFDYTYYRQRAFRPFLLGETVIKTDTINSDDQGMFAVKFKAVPGLVNKAVKKNYTYTISADITDASGETHSAQSTVNVGPDNLAIENYLSNLLLAKDSIKSTVSLKNLNGQSQKGVIKVEVHALQNPGHIFKNRLWNEKPDQFIVSADDFKNDFPDYAYQDEDSFANWKKLNKVAELSINVDEDKPGIIDFEPLRKQASGVYEIKMSARNQTGDTTSVTRYVYLLAQPARPSGFNNWVTPVLNMVKPGEQAEFFVGIDEKVSVLIERYNGVKLHSSKWVTVEKGQQSFKFPISVNDKDAAVQFMMVYHNRVYNSYQKIYLLNNENDLKIKLLTFRDKLQPGQKEQWKLQITNQSNQKQAAEMLASLYDASLDDITPAIDWRNALNPQQTYHPNYFQWNSYNFLNATNTQPLGYKQYAEQIVRNYEKLNLFDYNYYGGYNHGYRNYLEKAKKGKSISENDKRLEADYYKSVAGVKNGYDVNGTVQDATDGIVIPGVTVAVNGRAVTHTNSKGMFKIRVPKNATLSFRFIGYLKNEVLTTKAVKLNIKLTPDEKALNEIAVVGYGTMKRKEVTGAVQQIRLRGLSSVSADNALAGKVAGVQITEVRHSGYFNESLRREIPAKGIKPPVIRTNFNETAFFYPQLHTDSKGGIAIEFTIPEALTKWRFRALAHTKELNTGYIEREVVTQKQLSISANMPRFLREGDTLTISARLANLTADQLKGKVTLQLFNAMTMQPVALLQNPADADQPFEIAAVTNKAVSFKIIIPKGLDALAYRLTAEADNYNDGEENTVPVLPNRMLVTESMPMMVRAGQTRNFNFNRLINSKSSTLQNKAVTLEYTQNPVWYAVQALPYMMEFQYECSEQIFSRYYANSIAAKLVNTMPVIKRVFDTWKNSNSPELLSNLEKNQELKNTLLEETPWLRDATSEAEQKKRIALLFDLNKMSYEQQVNLEKLQKKQLPDGGFPWFGGNYADRFITQHVLAGIGQLYHSDVADVKNETLETIRNGAVRYLDAKLIEDEQHAGKLKDQKLRDINVTETHAWYARSYLPNVPMSGAVKKIFTNYLNRAEKQWVSQSTYEQGMIALTMQRSGKSLIAKAIIRSLQEKAQQSDEMGMYWANNQSGYFWYQSPIETQCLLIELFTEVGGNDKAIDEMKIWLLRNKQTSNWKTTKATAAACYALLIKKGDQLSTTSTTEIKLNGLPLKELKPDVKTEVGTGYLKVNWANEQIKPELGKVEIKNNGQTISWGAMYWQYLEQLDKITPSTADIKLSRKYFIVKQTDSGPVSVVVDANHQPKIGDVLKVIVYLNAGRDFEYVHLKDMRPAGTEPVDNLSAYKYQDGLYYYQATRDVATNFFISTLNKGNYVFEYQLRVSQPGNFSTGIATVQCMYAPEFGAHSDGVRINFKP